MKPQVTRENTYFIEKQLYSADASDLMLAPDEYPATLTTNMGNGRELLFDGHCKTSKGEYLWTDYKQKSTRKNPLAPIRLRLFRD